MRTTLALLLLASTSAGAFADGLDEPSRAPVRGYSYTEEYQEYGEPPVVIDRRPIIVEEHTGPVFVVPPPGYLGPPISLRRYHKLLDRGQDPFAGYDYDWEGY